MFDPEEITIPANRLRMLWNLIIRLIILGFVYLFWRKALATSLPDDQWLIALVVFLTVYSALSALGLLIMLLDPRPALVLNSTGILRRNSPFKSQLIYWQDTTKIEIYSRYRRRTRYRTWPMLLIKVSNPDAYIAQSPILQWPLLKLNKFFYGTPFCTSMSLLSGKSDEIKDRIFAASTKYRKQMEKQ